MAPLLVSIVVPTLRRPHLLRDCVTSLGEQTYAGSLYEIIVVADGPQRDVRELVAELPRRADGPAVRYVEIDRRA
jgi:glycosyltransferase involved in cell wall biosynthesis